MALHTFSQYFDPLYFLIALSIGLFYTYLTTPMPEIIIKYPTPENAGKIIYKDTKNLRKKFMYYYLKMVKLKTKFLIKYFKLDRI